jgi:signal recognition particle GTPase
MMPGMGKMKAGAADEKALGRLDAIISSMTKQERAKPEILQAKRKIRIAKGAGTRFRRSQVLKMHQEMANAMKKIRKMGGLGNWPGCSQGRNGRHARRAWRHGDRRPAERAAHRRQDCRDCRAGGRRRLTCPRGSTSF